MPLESGGRLGPYVLHSPIGTGGMGEVWKARDERLGRDVALKVLHGESGDRERFRREARLAAAVNHPNVCQVFDVGEHGDEPYLAMELLEGESLGDRLEKGPLPCREALETALQVLAALEALHARGLVHRDLKPTNVFLTPHGVKLLDFGLARPLHLAPGDRLTKTGMLVGTPRYMAPEQWNGEDVGPAADVFSCGALLFEMASGRPAFDGESLPELLTSITSGRTPALAGSPAAEALDRVVRRALSPSPTDRFPSASAMSAALREGSGVDASTGGAAIRAVTRLAVLPFRLLRPDPDLDFLGPALAEAVSAALGGVSGLVLRGSRLAERFADRDDLPAVAREIDVDSLVVGTLQRAGDRVRLTTQLVDGASGRVLHAGTAQAALTDLFDLQDDLTRQVAEGLRIALTPREIAMLAREHPANPEAYELYLRALRLPVTTGSPRSMREARDLLRACLEKDPAFAPGWARVARLERLLGKYGNEDTHACERAAREAFDRAFALDPDLSLAHNLYTYFEIEELASPVPAMRRLLGRLERNAADPLVFAGLVAACRFCGLLEASLAADEKARRLDPKTPTSVAYTLFLLGDYDRAAASEDDLAGFVRQNAIAMTWPRTEAAESWGRWKLALEGVERDMAETVHAALRGDPVEASAAARRGLDSGFRDPEGVYLVARALALLGDRDLAFEPLWRSVRSGFTVPSHLSADPWLDALRPDPRFREILALAESAKRHATDVFVRAGGPRLLGLDASRTLVIDPPSSRSPRP